MDTDHSASGLEQIRGLLRFDAGVVERGTVVIGRHCFVRQAMALLKIAHSTNNSLLPF